MGTRHFFCSMAGEQFSAPPKRILAMPLARHPATRHDARLEVWHAEASTTGEASSGDVEPLARGYVVPSEPSCRSGRAPRP
jgi:hypothetical protein